VCGASYGERSHDRVNSRNGYRHREWDTWAGSIDLAVPKLRQGSYFPGVAAGAAPPGRGLYRARTRSWA
jgi:transposase-like protein